MKIAGVTGIRDEIERIEFVIKHHLSQGCDYIFVYDNGSTDGTLELVQQMSEKDSRIIWHSDPGPYQQQLQYQYLFGKAKEYGCEWIVPFDGDEIIVSENGLKNDLITVTQDAIQLGVRHFVQSTNYDEDKIFSNTNWRFPLNAKPVDFRLVEENIFSMVELLGSPKHIFRNVNYELDLSWGTHVSSAKTVLNNAEKFKMYSVTLSSKKHLLRKSENGRRIRELPDFNAGLGFEAQRLYLKTLDGSIYNEWVVNSEVDGKVKRYDGTVFELEFDDEDRGRIESEVG